VDVFANTIDAAEISTTDVVTDSVSTDQITTVGTHTIQAIHDAAATHELLILEEGATYSGSSTATLNPDGRDVLVMAHGATVDYTGSGVAIDIPTNESNFRGSVRWVGGVVTGPGNAGTSRGFRVSDVYGVSLRPIRVDDFDVGIYARNDTSWTEFLDIGLDDSFGCNSVVRLEGATQTGGAGTDSFKGFTCDVTAHTTDKILDIRDADVYGSKITTWGFLDDSEVCLSISGTSVSFDGTELFLDAEHPGGGASEGTGVDIQATIYSPPAAPTLRFNNLSVDVNNPSGEPWPYRESDTAGHIRLVGQRSIGRSLMQSTTVSLADDSATSFDVSGDKLLFVIGDKSKTESGFFGTGFGAVSDFGSTSMSVESGTLSGTTGGDGTLNISRDGNDLYLENRTGGSRDISVMRIGQTA
jgi:hypothetical protein